MSGKGLATMTPTSVDVSGTGATINADGSVSFTAITSLSLNGVFTAAHRNYVVVITADISTSDFVRLRLRASGVDVTGSGYDVQTMLVDGSNALADRSTGRSDWLLTGGGTKQYAHVHIYRPQASVASCARSVGVANENTVSMRDRAQSHTGTSAYDGITFYLTTHNATGLVTVFGYEE